MGKKKIQKDKKAEKPQTDSTQELISSIFSLAFIVIMVFAFKSSILDANNIPSGSMIPTLKIGDFLFVNKMRYSLRIPFLEKEIYRIDDPKRGDIVTLVPPRAAVGPGESLTGIFAKRFVKRVIGMPGDTIRIRRERITTSRGLTDFAFLEYKEQGTAEFKGYNPVEVPREKNLSDLDNPNAAQRTLFLEEKPGFKHFVLEGFDDIRVRLSQQEHCDFSEGCKIPGDSYMVVGDNRDDSHDSRAWGFVKRDDILGKALIIYFSIDWKDNSCMFKDEDELAEKGAEFASRYFGEELQKHCHPIELPQKSEKENIRNESGLTWLERTLRYRIWRMEIRWRRIGKILE